MIKINLLPFRAARKKENIRFQISIFLLSLIFIVLGMVYHHISGRTKINNLEDQVTTTKIELAKYEEKAKEVDKIKKKLQSLEKKINIIADLKKNRENAVRLLDAMTEIIIAKRMWFTNFQSGNKIVSITGIALDNKTIADFMTSLEKSNFFKTVDLKSSRQKAIRKRKLKSFTIICTTAA